MKNKMQDLRNHLFEMLETLKDPEAKVDLDRFRLGADIAQTLINSAKVEVDFLKTVGGTGSGFIPDDPKTISAGGAPLRVAGGKGG